MLVEAEAPPGGSLVDCDNAAISRVGLLERYSAVLDGSALEMATAAS